MSHGTDIMKALYASILSEAFGRLPNPSYVQIVKDDMRQSDSSKPAPEEDAGQRKRRMSKGYRPDF